MTWILGAALWSLMLGLWLGRAMESRVAARERRDLYQQWLAVSAKQADAMRCPGRALAALRQYLRVNRVAAAPSGMRRRAQEIEMGDEPTDKELVALLRSLAGAAERPRA